MPSLRSFALTLTLATPLAALALAPSTAHAGDSCTSAADLGSKVWGETPGVVKNAIAAAGPFGATAMKAANLIDEGIKIWNRLASDKSWAKIGPRRMDYGEWNTGTLIGPTERKFLSGIPAVNPVKIDFHKLDFEGKVKVVVCKVPEKGKAKVVKSFIVPAGAKPGKIKSFTIDDAKGHIISVVLHGKSATKKLKYKVRAKFVYEDPAENVEDDPDHSVSAPGARQPDHKVSAPRG